MLRNDKMVGLFFIIGNELITESEHFTKGKQEGAIYRYSKTLVRNNRVFTFNCKGNTFVNI